VPDKRAHRGPHPEDRRWFAPERWPAIREAVDDLSWLLTRGYAPDSALKLVGARHGLQARQRTAVQRCACSDADRRCRQTRQVQPVDLAGQELWIDGYNALTTVEAALSGGIILLARDGCYRDMASMHGSYRKVDETRPALEHLGSVAAELRLAACRWYLDRPVSNSGRLKQLMEDVAAAHAWRWHVELVPNPDPLLKNVSPIIATADSVILDHCRRWFNLARETIARRVPQANVLDFSNSPLDRIAVGP